MLAAAALKPTRRVLHTELDNTHAGWLVNRSTVARIGATVASRIPSSRPSHCKTNSSNSRSRDVTFAQSKLQIRDNSHTNRRRTHQRAHKTTSNAIVTIESIKNAGHRARSRAHRGMHRRRHLLTNIFSNFKVFSRTACVHYTFQWPGSIRWSLRSFVTVIEVHRYANNSS